MINGILFELYAIAKCSASISSLIPTKDKCSLLLIKTYLHICRFSLVKYVFLTSILYQFNFLFLEMCMFTFFLLNFIKFI